MKNRLITLLLLVLPAFMAAQTMKLQGTVVSSVDGLPMPGVSVTVVGTGTGTSTDMSGKYMLNAKGAGTVKFSFVGCKTVIRKFNGSSTINVSLDDDTHMLNEVVAIGYGTMKKSDLTGSVTVINADKLKRTPASSVDQALQGRAAGVTVNANSGQPGAAAEVRIRGIGTVNNAAPIYVVDGVIVDDISFVSPNDIESTEILKDASATAIYGSRGANGVILINTKKGEKGKAQVSFDMYYGWQNRWKKLDLMGRDEFVNKYLELNAATSEKNYFKNKGFNEWLQIFKLGNDKHFAVAKTAKYPNGLDYSSIDTDWQDEVFKSNAVIQNYHASIDGGTDKANYSFSTSYFSQDGTIMGSNYDRLTVRANTSFQVKSWLKIGENLSYVHSKGRNAMNNNSSPGASVLSAAIAMAPWDPTYYPAGSANKAGDDFSGRIATPSNFKNVVSPFSMVYNSNPEDKTSRWIGDAYVEITPFKGFTFRSDISYDEVNTESRLFKPAYELSTYDYLAKNYLSRSMSHATTLIWENVANYQTKIKEHSINIMLGQTTEEYNYYSMGGSGSNIMNPIETNWYLSQTTEDRGYAGDAVSRTRRLSFLGRLHYTYKDRYLLTFNFRADGSNKFPENTWGYFPSLALGWKMSEESWMKEIKGLDYLKMRFGWGLIGNDKIGNDSFNQTVYTTGPTFTDYPLGVVSTLTPGATILTYVNQGGKWEKTETWNLGFDAAFMNGLLSANVDFFIRNTKDMLLTVKGPAYIGNRYDAQKNVGTVRNKGIEITLGHQNKIGDLHYTVDGNVSFIDNKLTALNGGNPVWGAYTVCDQGYSLYTFWGYKYLGVYKTDEEAKQYLWGYTDAERAYYAGDAKFADLNNDGKIDDNDKTDLGSPFPWLTYGLNIGADWKGFDLQMFFQGVYGNKIYNQMRVRTEGDGTQATLSTAMRNVWTADNVEGTIPNPKGNSNNFAASSRFVESGAYLRLKNIQLGYTIPEKITKKYGINKCRVYISGSNLLTFTNYDGYDPEVNGGVDYGNYPQARTVLLGLNLNF